MNSLKNLVATALRMDCSSIIATRSNEESLRIAEMSGHNVFFVERIDPTIYLTYSLLATETARAEYAIRIRESDKNSKLPRGLKTPDAILMTACDGDSIIAVM